MVIWFNKNLDYVWLVKFATLVSFELVAVLRRCGRWRALCGWISNLVLNFSSSTLVMSMLNVAHPCMMIGQPVVLTLLHSGCDSGIKVDQSWSLPWLTPVRYYLLYQGSSLLHAWAPWPGFPFAAKLVHMLGSWLSWYLTDVDLWIKRSILYIKCIITHVRTDLANRADTPSSSSLSSPELLHFKIITDSSGLLIITVQLENASWDSTILIFSIPYII